MNAEPGITVTRNAITGSARVDIDLGDRSRPLAYRVVASRDGSGYTIRDPFGAAIESVASFERAIEIATGLAANVREWADEHFDC
jgi:hypothetical protein